MRTRTVVAAAGVVGLLLTQAACGDDTDADTTEAPGTAPSPAADSEPASPSPGEDPGAPPAAGDDDAILNGDRQVSITIAEQPNIMVVDEQGLFGPGDRNAQWHQFVLTPHGDYGHLIQTAESGDSGEPYCMGLDGSSEPVTVVAAACDAGRTGQVFTVEPVEAADGEPAYAISSEGAYLRVTGDMRLIAEPGDASSGTNFRFDDEGEAPPRPGE